MADCWNFCAGPCTLPAEVWRELAAELPDYGGTGMSLMEMSHRGDIYAEIHKDVQERLRQLWQIPEDFEVLLLQGGATLQFSMVPMNLLGGGRHGGYAVNGQWSARAFADAAACAKAYKAWEGRHAAADGPIKLRPDTRYLHLTSNETMDGVQWRQWPDAAVPLVADMSSDILSRPLDWQRFDLVYASSQKNLGPSGATVVVLRKRLMDGGGGSYLDYAAHAKSPSGSLNTPPTFSIYAMGKMLAWVQARGGVPEMQERAARRSRIIYDAMDASDGFYHSPVMPEHRSQMNVVFRLPDDERTAQFLAQARQAGLHNLKGHRRMGGCRASLYNGLPIAAAEALAAFMTRFQTKNR